MNYNERKELLLKPVWTYRDVMAYCEVKKSKAFLIIKECKEKLNGRVLFNEHGVKRDSVLAYNSSSIEQERYILQQLEQELT